MSESARGEPLQPTDGHTITCPFCGESFDSRDVRKVAEHCRHQAAAGLPATGLKPAEDIVRWLDTLASWEEVCALYHDLETVAFWQDDGTLSVETNDGRGPCLSGIGC